MKMEPILNELEGAAEKLGVKVSYEPLVTSVDGGGGLCKVNGTYRVIIDKRSTIGEKVVTLAMSLAGFKLDSVVLSPEIRTLVARYRSAPVTSAA